MTTPDAPDTPDASDSADSPAAASSDRVASGVLVAEKSAGTQLARHRRWLIGGGVLGLLLLFATVGGRAMLQAQANREAVEVAARAEARATLAAAVIDIAEAFELPTVRIDVDAQQLRRSLEAHLAIGAGDAEAVDARRDATIEDLRDAAELLRAETTFTAPVPDELVSRARALSVLTELETLRAEAGALADEVDAVIVEAEDWSLAVRQVQEKLAAYIAVVEEQPATTDPGRLIEQWQVEVVPLQQLAAASRLASAVPGLDTWAAAHEDYANSSIAWVAEAVGLLEVVDVDRYNARVEELFGGEDPFDFVAAATAGAEDALMSPALIDLATVVARADLVLESVTTLEQVVLRELSEDGPPSEEPQG